MATADAAATNTRLATSLAENHQRFLSFLERRVGNREVAEDILQSAFVRTLERGEAVRDEERAVAWFYRLLRNAVVDHWRARGAEHRGLERLLHDLPEEVITPEIEAELCRCYVALLPTLPPGYANMLERVDLGGERVVDVAASEGLSANNATVRLHRARRALRDRLAQSCRTCATHGCLDCSCGPAKTVG
jgi:RNA polymerase sigma-70 factor (ECF subfamily)